MRGGRGLRQRALHCVEYALVYRAAVAEAHFDFCGVHVHIHVALGQFKEEDHIRVPVGGKKILIRAAHRARHIGFVFQNFNLWPHMSILDNIIEAPRRVLGQSKAEAIEVAEALLAKVGIADKRHAYPAQLSGGQQQRAAIARTLAMQPKVILFDEPTSALDPEMVQEVLSVIRALAEEGRTMLLVTHEMGFARQVSSEVVFLHQGLIEEQGSPQQVFENPLSARCKQFMSSNR